MLRRLRTQSTALWAVMGVLACTVGVTVTIGATAHALLIRPLPGPDTGSLVTLGGLSHGGGMDEPISYWSRADGLDSLALVRAGDLPIVAPDTTGWVRVAEVAGPLFAVFRTQPVIGRAFSPSDEKQDEAIAIVGNAFWRSHLSGSPDVVGRKIRLGETQYVIVGVAAPGFDFPSATQVWIPRARTESRRPLLIEGAGSLPLLRRPLGWVGRLKEGSTVAQLQAQLEALLAHANDVLSRTTHVRYGDVIGISPLQESIVSSYRPTVTLLLIGATMTMAAAVVNCALFAVSFYGRRRTELAVRKALGASTGRLLSQLFMEASIVGLVTGLGALLSAALLTGLARQALYSVGVELTHREWLWPSILCASMSLSVLAVTTGAAISVGTVLQTDAAGVLNSVFGSRSDLAGRRLRGPMIAAQVALAFILSAGGIASIKSAVALSDVNLGHDPRRFVLARIGLLPRVFEGRDLQEVQQNLVHTLATVEGVSTLGAVRRHPVQKRDRRFQQVASDSGTTVMTSVGDGSGDYIAAIGIPTLVGRDSVQHLSEALISESLARRMWGAPEAALGQNLRIAGRPDGVQVVGVFKDISAVDEQQTVPFLFVLPSKTEISAPAPPISVDIVARCTADCSDTAVNLHAKLAGLQGIFVYSVTRGHELYDRIYRPVRVQMWIWTVYALVGLAVSTFGVFALVSHSIAARETEIGIRLAVGASRGKIVGLVVQEAFLLVTVGVGLGILGARWITVVQSASIYGATLLDTRTTLSVAALVAVTCALAALVATLRISTDVSWSRLIRR